MVGSPVRNGLVTVGPHSSEIAFRVTCSIQESGPHQACRSSALIDAIHVEFAPGGS